MVGGTYLGVVCALVGLLLSRRATEDGPLALLAIELEGAQQALMGAARELEQQRAADATVYAKALCTRFMVQGAIERSSNLAVEALGGISFIASDEVAYLLAASRAICFHPISRAAATPLLASYLRESA
jgi:alkylation response protein AidB-like acyl-CoA dehydrogenase